MTSTDVARRQPPAPLPIPAEDPKTLMERMQALYAKFVKGKTAEVDPRFVEVREYAKFAIEQWEMQLAIANFEIQRQMGDAQFATVGGVTVVQRMQFPKKGYVVDAQDMDYLMGKKH